MTELEKLKTNAINEIKDSLETKKFTIDDYSKILYWLRDLKGNEIIKEND